ncbi:TRAP transporter small permease [Mesorhizobium sp. CAU 1741]|uniref:TRAP transporter small permease n=1 Tax=Mesorhizobium sp. CAU 1741 TaxID=3140366 RepID=UPI00325AE1C4
MDTDNSAGGSPASGAPSLRAAPLGWATEISSVVGTLMIVAIMVLINADVGMRYLFNQPIPGVAEIVSASIVTIIFLQLPDCIFSGRMIRSDMWIGRLTARRPRAAAGLETAFNLLGAVMLALIVYYVYPKVARAYSATHTIGVYGVFLAPVWPFYAGVLVGAALATVEYAVATVHSLRLAIATPSSRSEDA